MNRHTPKKAVTAAYGAANPISSAVDTQATIATHGGRYSCQRAAIERCSLTRFFRCGSSTGENAGLSIRKMRVRLPSAPPVSLPSRRGSSRRTLPSRSPVMQVRYLPAPPIMGSSTKEGKDMRGVDGDGETFPFDSRPISRKSPGATLCKCSRKCRTQLGGSHSIAPVGERLSHETFNLVTAGSNPVRSPNSGQVAQFGRARGR